MSILFTTMLLVYMFCLLCDTPIEKIDSNRSFYIWVPVIFTSIYVIERIVDVILILKGVK